MKLIKPIKSIFFFTLAIGAILVFTQCRSKRELPKFNDPEGMTTYEDYQKRN